MGHRSPIMIARYSEFADSERGFDSAQPRPIPSEAEGRRWAFARADITKGIALPRADAAALTR
jgi:hypothetical protein